MKRKRTAQIVIVKEKLDTEDKLEVSRLHLLNFTYHKYLHKLYEMHM